MKRYHFLPAFLGIALIFAACKDDDPVISAHNLIFQFKFDSTQARLNNLGMPASMPSGHAGQCPKMNKMSAHYLELAPGALTQLGAGEVLYKAAETTAGGANAIDFAQSTLVSDGGTFLTVPLRDVTPGDYEYLRVSLAYQNYDVKLWLDTTVTVPGVGTFPIQQYFPGTVASFVGFNTYITSYVVKTQTVTVNDDKAQGYWGYECQGDYMGYPVNYLQSGEAPANATTVVNPISSTSPIPAGSCVVTAAFSGGKLKITGEETEDIVVEVSLSTNHSFEWIEQVADGRWEPGKGEVIVDMGLRGMVPRVK